MPPYALLIEESGDPSAVRGAVGSAMALAGLQLRTCADVDVALAELRDQDVSEIPALVVLGPDVAEATRAARRLHLEAPSAPLVFLVDTATATLAREVESPVAMIGSQWHIVEVRGHDLQPVLQAISQRAVQRHQLRATLDRINEQVAEPPRRARTSQGGSSRASEQLLTHLLENASDAIIATNLAGDILLWNGAADRILGLSSAEAIGRPLPDVCGGEWGTVVPEMLASLASSGEGHARREIVCRRPNGEEVNVELAVSRVRDAAAAVFGAVAIARDIGERKRLEHERSEIERQMQQAQKLESLGVLAGGIAHDFNNLLTGVLGNADLALLDLGATSPAHESLEEIRKASLRAADLCKQMLAYSGRGKFLVQPISLNEVITDMAQLLKLSISKTAVVKTDLADDLPAMEADVSQIRQVIMNLITNASEAIGNNPGVIAIRTSTIECDREFLSQMVLAEELKEGTYLSLEVSDSGAGMGRDTLARIFDPFFTTKFSGRGLGLAAVLGIVRGHRGALRVYSEKGHGTTFRIFFPPTTKAATSLVDEPAEVEVVTGQGTVLVVDDEDIVRTVAARTLKAAGYTVLTAADGLEGITIFHQHAHEINLVLIDLTMPQLGGDVVFAEMQVVNPDTPIILMSGYSQQELSNRFAGRGLAGFLQKPLRPKALLTMVGATLAARDGTQEGPASTA